MEDPGTDVASEALFESGGGLQLRIDDALIDGGAALEARSCLGGHARFPRLDSFGRRLRVPCCNGNTFAIQGEAPTGSTVDQCAHAMGLDVGHMGYASMAKALPPAYISYVFGQMAMHVARERYGVPSITFDEMLADPAAARRQMYHLLRGAGGTSPQADISLVDAAGSRVRDSHRSSVSLLPVVRQGEGEAEREVAGREPLTPSLGETASESEGETITSSPTSSGGNAANSAMGQHRSPAVWSLAESDFREIDYSFAGDYDQIWLETGARDWLAPLCAREVLTPSTAGCAESWRERNTFVHVRDDALAEVLPQIQAALRESAGDTRLTVAISEGDDVLLARLCAMGFRRVMAMCAAETRVLRPDGSTAQMAADLLIMAAGERECRAGGHWLEHADVEHLMDPRDRGEPSGPPGQKAAIAWSPLRRDPSGWVGKGLPARIERIMTEGVDIEPIDPDSVISEFETAQYAWPGACSFVHGVAECDRAIMAGHLEPVPASEVVQSLERGWVHPWTVIQQTKDKWRDQGLFERDQSARGLIAVHSALGLGRETRRRA